MKRPSRDQIKQIRSILPCFSAVLFLLLAGCARTPEDRSPAPWQGEPIVSSAPEASGEPAGSRSDTGNAADRDHTDQDFNFNGKDMDMQNPRDDTSEESLSEKPPQAIPGLHTLENLLLTAFLPVGQTMYVWGGGWNEEDTGAGTDAVSIGLSPSWKTFADQQTADYQYRDTRYQIHDGLDCSGYVGWVVYNTMESENGREGFVIKSTDTAKAYAELGFGDFTAAGSVTDWLPGDIASMKGHVWICLGTCEDGSVLLVHSSPPGVRLCGTVPASGSSEAQALAEHFMAERFPHWYERFPDCAVSNSYLETAGQMRWNEKTFSDAKAIQSLSPEEVLERLLDY